MRRGNVHAGLMMLIWLAGSVAATQPTAPRAPNGGFGIHEQAFVVELLSPLSTRTARAGDTFTTSVRSPNQFRNAIVEGRILSLKKAARGFRAGKPELQMDFYTLSWSGRTESIHAQLRGVTNSKGVSGVDDEGHALGYTPSKKRLAGAAGGAGMGAPGGVLRVGVADGVIGAVAGGVTGYIMNAKFTSEDPDIEFRPGSLFTLQVSDGGSSPPRR